MKVVILFLATLAVGVSCLGEYEDMAQDMDMLLKRLHTTDLSNLGKHRLSRHSIFEPLLTIGSNDFKILNTHDIKLEGIEKLNRTSVAPGIRAQGGFGSHPPSNVLYVQFSVKNGINMTSDKFEYTYNGFTHFARFMGRWKNNTTDAVFRLSGVSFNGLDNFKVDSVNSNIDKDKFDLTLTCYDSRDQPFCNHLQVHYLNTWKFDIHTFIQKTFNSEIEKISSKKA